MRNGRNLASLTTELGTATGGPYVVRWKAPKRLKGKMTFCVRASDPTGNQSAESCAQLSIKGKKKKRGKGKKGK